jgi:hypothetical protein
MVDAHVMAFPSAGGGAPFVIVFVVTNFVKLEADSRSDLSNVKPPLQEIHMASLNVNFEQISTNLNLFSHDYCKYLQKKGLLDSCEYESEEIVLESTRLWIHDKAIQSNVKPPLQEILPE